MFSFSPPIWSYWTFLFLKTRCNGLTIVTLSQSWLILRLFYKNNTWPMVLTVNVVRDDTQGFSSVLVLFISQILTSKSSCGYERRKNNVYRPNYVYSCPFILRGDVVYAIEFRGPKLYMYYLFYVHVMYSMFSI